MDSKSRIAVFCVGNRLMLDDGLGPAVYDELLSYSFDPAVDLLDLGCLTMDRIEAVRDYDFILSVDAVDGTGKAPGTIFRFKPEDAQTSGFGTQSLHDMKLADLFAHALLLGYECEGLCFGMQVKNASPALVTEGLTPEVYRKIPELVDCVLAELYARGVQIREKGSGALISPGFHHRMTGTGPQ